MLGERLQRVRKFNRDTQQSLADKLHVSLHAVASWEQDESDPRHDTLVRICRLYYVSSDYLLGLKNEDDAYIMLHRRKPSPENQRMQKEFKSYYAMFGMNVVYYRRRKRLSRVMLAELVGISRDYMSEIEKGITDVSFDVLFRLCEVLEIAPQQLFCFRE